MDAIRRQRLADIMSAADDPAAEIALFLEFGSEVGSVVRASVRSHGGSDRLDRDDVDNLTYDVCAELFRIRCSWRPDGRALPWKWARARIDAIVRSRIGPPQRRLRLADLDERAEVSIPAVGDHEPVTSTLRRLSAVDGRLRAADVLVGRLSDRTAEMLLRYQIQIDAGDPSPSHTIGAEFGLRPDAVRQAVARARRVLSRAVDDDPEFAAFRSSPLLGREAAA